eukprot:CAMPEP_0119121060 /NCGR_PEP_ID=MMETSP1310-20130426/1851_1 /TAXON_ID=464262 /ORGANISM="Genus nov. species nov., Strain RCC2339" /LENGTH=522 /DNA_ID=CAMNT_0007110595 /DNA_START=350 /DNA_END=1918 /DNA_ORIENTATION=+
MVLEEGSPGVKIWGFGDNSGRGVKVRLIDDVTGRTLEEHSAWVQENLVWNVTLSPRDAGDTVYRIVLLVTLASDPGPPGSTGPPEDPAPPDNPGKGHGWGVNREEVVSILYNVVFGRLLLCSGQSNMEFSISASNTADETVRGANNSLLRLMTLNRNEARFPVRNAPVRQTWMVADQPPALCGPGVPCVSPCNNGDVRDWGWFSAVCMYAGQRLQKEWKVPVGLVSASYGGTVIEQWVPPESFDECGLDSTADGASGLWNGMIHPLLLMRVRGFLWWQGESNGFAGDLESYACLFPSLIRAWRQRWYASADVMFSWVQVSSYTYPPVENVAPLRWSQTAGLAEPNVSWATAVDIFDPASPCLDVHPRQKKIVGERLALSVLRPQSSAGPILLSVSRTSGLDGGVRLTLVFDRSLRTELAPVFHEAPDDAVSFQRYVNQPGAWVVIPTDEISVGGESGTNLEIDLDSSEADLSIRYAWSSVPQSIVYDREGLLPAPPFWFQCADDSCTIPPAWEFPPNATSIA